MFQDLPVVYANNSGGNPQQGGNINPHQGGHQELNRNLIERLVIFIRKCFNEDMKDFFERTIWAFDQTPEQLRNGQGETLQQYALFQEYIEILDQKLNQFAMQEGYNVKDAGPDDSAGAGLLLHLQDLIHQDKKRAEMEFQNFFQGMRNLMKASALMSGRTPEEIEKEFPKYGTSDYKEIEDSLREVFCPRTCEDLINMITGMLEYNWFSTLCRARCEQEKMIKKVEEIREQKKLVVEKSVVGERLSESDRRRGVPNYPNQHQNPNSPTSASAVESPIISRPSQNNNGPTTNNHAEELKPLLAIRFVEFGMKLLERDLESFYARVQPLFEIGFHTSPSYIVENDGEMPTITILGDYHYHDGNHQGNPNNINKNPNSTNSSNVTTQEHTHEQWAVFEEYLKHIEGALMKFAEKEGMNALELFNALQNIVADDRKKAEEALKQIMKQIDSKKKEIQRLRLEKRDKRRHELLVEGKYKPPSPGNNTSNNNTGISSISNTGKGNGGPKKINDDGNIVVTIDTPVTLSNIDEILDKEFGSITEEPTIVVKRPRTLSDLIEGFIQETEFENFVNMMRARIEEERIFKMFFGVFDQSENFSSQNENVTNNPSIFPSNGAGPNTINDAYVNRNQLEQQQMGRQNIDDSTTRYGQGYSENNAMYQSINPLSSSTQPPLTYYNPNQNNPYQQPNFPNQQTSCCCAHDPTPSMNYYQSQQGANYYQPPLPPPISGHQPNYSQPVNPLSVDMQNLEIVDIDIGNDFVPSYMQQNQQQNQQNPGINQGQPPPGPYYDMSGQLQQGTPRNMQQQYHPTHAV